MSYFKNINESWIIVPDDYDDSVPFTRYLGLCDSLRPGFETINEVFWLRGPTERCIASTATLAHCILAIYPWLGRPVKDFQEWREGSSPPTLNTLLKEAKIDVCYTQRCEMGYAIAFATRFPVEEVTRYTLESPYKLEIYQSSEDIDKAHWGWFGYFLFSSAIINDPAWPSEA